MVSKEEEVMYGEEVSSKRESASGEESTRLRLQSHLGVDLLLAMAVSLSDSKRKSI